MAWYGIKTEPDNPINYGSELKTQGLVSPKLYNLLFHFTEFKEPRELHILPFPKASLLPFQILLIVSVSPYLSPPTSSGAGLIFLWSKFLESLNIGGQGK